MPVFDDYMRYVAKEYDSSYASQGYAPSQSQRRADLVNYADKALKDPIFSEEEIELPEELNSELTQAETNYSKQIDLINKNKNDPKFSNPDVVKRLIEISEPSDIRNEANLARQGVETRNELPVDDVVAGFSPDPVQTMRNKLTEHFIGKGAIDEGKKVLTFQTEQGDILFKNPETGKLERANIDWKGKLGMAIPIATEVVSTLAVRKGSPAAMVGKETGASGVGASLGKFIQLKIGQAMDAHDMTDEDILKESGLYGAQAAAITGVVGSVLAGGKGFLNFIRGGRFTKSDIDNYDMSDDVKEVTLEAMNKVIRERGGQKQAKGTLYQKTSDPGDQIEIGARQAEIQKKPEFAGRFEKRRVEDQEALSEAADLMLKKEQAPYAGKQTVGEVAESRTGHRIEQAKDIVGQRSKTAETLQKNLDTQIKAMDAVPYRTVGEETRNVLLKEQEDAYKKVGSMWDDVRQSGGYNDKTRAYGIDLKVSGDLKQFRDTLVRRMKSAQTKIESKGISGLLKTSKKPQDLADYSHELSNLKEMMRTAKKNKQFGSTSTKDLDDYIAFMEKERDAQLIKQGRSDLVNKIKLAELESANFHKNFNRSYVGELTKTNEKGIPVISSDEFVDNMLRSDKAEIDQLLSTIGDNPELMAKWRKGLLNHYRDKVAPDGKVNKRASDNWLKSYEDKISGFMSKDQIGALKSLPKLSEKSAKAAENLVQGEKHLAKIKANSQKYGGQSLQSMTPEGIVKYVNGNAGWNTPTGMKGVSKINRIKYVKNITKDYPAAWQRFKNDYKDSIREVIIDKETWSVNVKQLYKIINTGENKKAITELFGEKYLKDLETIAASGKILKAQPKVLSKDETKGIIEQVGRAVYFAPLTQRGRGFTAALSSMDRASHKVLANAILDERTIKEVAKFSTHNRLTRQFFEKAASIGLIIDEGLADKNYDSTGNN